MRRAAAEPSEGGRRKARRPHGRDVQSNSRHFGNCGFFVPATTWDHRESEVWGRSRAAHAAGLPGESELRAGGEPITTGDISGIRYARRTKKVQRSAI